MRKLFMLAGCLFALTCALSLGPAVAEASQTCTVTCSSGATLQCCLSSGSCSTTSNSINCNGTMMTCEDVDAYNACRTACTQQRDACGWNVCRGDRDCYREVCIPEHMDCLIGCGGATTNIGCS